MKLKNIFTLISFLVLVVSCSMEDDVLNEMTKSDPQNDSSQTEVYLSVNTIVNTTTKAGTGSSANDGTLEDDFTSCSIIFCDGEKILGVYDGLTKDETVDKKFLAKVGRTYDILVVADAIQPFISFTSKSAIMSYVLNATDMNASVKFGQKLQYTVKGPGSPSTSAIPTEPVDIELKQLTAKVQLMAVNVSFAPDAVKSSVTLKNVQLFNQKVKITIDPALEADMIDDKDGKDSKFVEFTPVWTTAMPLYNADGVTKDTDYETMLTNDEPLAEFSTFPNSDEDFLTSLGFTLKIGNRWADIEREYIINRLSRDGFTNGTNPAHAYIKAGHIYQLTANIIVTKEDVICTLEFEVMPWNLEEVSWGYTEIPGLTGANCLKWTSIGGSENILNKPNATLSMDNPALTPATCTFMLNAPQGATWHASLIYLEGDTDAFEFVDGTSSGNVGELATLNIAPKNSAGSQTNKVRLEIVVKTAGGDTIFASVLDPSEYGGSSMTIVQNKQV